MSFSLSAEKAPEQPSIDVIRQFHEISRSVPFRPLTSDESDFLSKCAPFDLLGILLDEITKLNAEVAQTKEMLQISERDFAGSRTIVKELTASKVCPHGHLYRQDCGLCHYERV